MIDKVVAGTLESAYSLNMRARMTLGQDGGEALSTPIQERLSFEFFHNSHRIQ